MTAHCKPLNALLIYSNFTLAIIHSHLLHHGFPISRMTPFWLTLLVFSLPCLSTPASCASPTHNGPRGSPLGTILTLPNHHLILTLIMRSHLIIVH